MTASTTAQPSVARRVVLVDFDWQDADLLPVLFRHPELSIRLVAGAGEDDPGLRVAELCGLPRTQDLGDLTREIFDLALVSERSTRRTQIEGLLRVLGTPCATPESFLNGTVSNEEGDPGIEAPLALHAAALESSLGGAPIDDLVHEALPELTREAADAPFESAHKRLTTAPPRVQSLEDFPSPADRDGLEQALLALITDTGAVAAELHAGRAGQLEMLAQVGEQDALMKGLVELALRLDQPQVVQRLSGPDEGKAWGAWPFRTGQRQGVLAAAGIDPAEGWQMWEKTVEELRSTWDLRDREQASNSFPLVPERQTGWLDRAEFLERLEMAVNRNRRDELRFVLRRVVFPEAQDAVEHFCQALPAQLRDTDCICRPRFYELLMLAPLAPNARAMLRKRVHTLFQQAWHETGRGAEIPALVEEEIELVKPDDRAEFMQRAVGWLGDA